MKKSAYGQTFSRKYGKRSKVCQKTVTRHVWKDYEELADDAKYTPQYRDLYAKRKETIERVFADAKEKHAMRYTQYRGLAQASQWVRLKFAAINLKKLALWKWRRISSVCTLQLIFPSFFLFDQKQGLCCCIDPVFRQTETALKIKAVFLFKGDCVPRPRRPAERSWPTGVRFPIQKRQHRSPGQTGLPYGYP